MLQANASIDYGYPWWLSYGHLVVLLPAAALFAIGIARGWGRKKVAALGVLTLWSALCVLETRFVLNINGPGTLPTQAFLSSGAGRVLDIGAGTGRSSIMVLQSRPQVQLVASDLFGDSFEHHFGHGDTPQQRLQRNLVAAGVASRATIATADMRKLPFEPASFDGVVSAYAMDHLNRQGSEEALAEAARVLKPGGEFLLIIVENDRWTKFAFGPLLSHGGTRGAGWWSDRVSKAGFRIAEQGSQPMTLYFLAKREPGTSGS